MFLRINGTAFSCFVTPNTYGVKYELTAPAEKVHKLALCYGACFGVRLDGGVDLELFKVKHGGLLYAIIRFWSFCDL